MSRFSQYISEVRSLPDDQSKAIRQVLNLHDKVKDAEWRGLPDTDITRKHMIGGMNDLIRLRDKIEHFLEKFQSNIPKSTMDSINRSKKEIAKGMKFAQKSVKARDIPAFAWEADVCLTLLHDIINKVMYGNPDSQNSYLKVPWGRNKY